MNATVKFKRKKHHWLLLVDKINVIKDVDSGMKHYDIADKYNLSRSVVSKVIKNKEKLIKTINSGEFNCRKRKSTKAVRDQQLEDALYMWFCQKRDTGQPVSGTMICEKAIMLKEKLNEIKNSDDDFKASHGWLDSFKRRHGIKQMTLQGEKIFANVEATIKFCFDFQSFLEEEKYNLHLVFNANETGINWKSLPNKTYENEIACSGRNQNKERITALFCGNVTGSFRLPVLVIGKSNSQRCFKHVSTLPVVYRTQDSAWMDSEIFLDWYTNCFRLSVKAMQARTGNREKVLLLLDNTKVHLSREILNAVDENFFVEFLPPKVTASIQPMDQGIIEKTKKIYRKNILTCLLHLKDSISVESFIKSLNLRDCCHYLASAFESLTEKNLENGWNILLGRSDFKSKEISDDDFTLTLASFSQMVKEVKGFEKTKISCTAKWLTDDQYDPGWAQLTDDEIIQQVLGHAEISNRDD